MNSREYHGKYSQRIHRLVDSLYREHPAQLGSSGLFEADQVNHALTEEPDLSTLDSLTKRLVEKDLKIVEKVGSFVTEQISLEHELEENEEKFLQALLSNEVRKNFASWAFYHDEKAKARFLQHPTKIGKSFKVDRERMAEVLLKARETLEGIHTDAMRSEHPDTDHYVRRPTAFYLFVVEKAIQKLERKRKKK
jgi:hypothetical protein